MNINKLIVYGHQLTLTAVNWSQGTDVATNLVH